MKTAGQCLCGEIRLAVEGGVSKISSCHCTDCRLSVGATPVVWAGFERRSLAITSGEPRWYRSSPGARRGFCGSCGCSMFFEEDDAPDEIDIAVAILDNVDELAPTRHLWASSRVAWAHLNDGVPVHVRESTSAMLDVAAPRKPERSQ